MKKETLLLLAKKYTEGNCTTEEKMAVEAFFDKMQDGSVIGLHQFPDTKRDVILGEIFQELQIKKQLGNFRFKKALKIAAILIAAIGISFSVVKFALAPKEIIQIALKGEKKEVLLEDGSVVVLNSNSSISYPEKFGQIRNIKLHGEAYFKVFRDTKRPFIVQTHDVKVRVLGTSFDVNSYKHRATKVSVLTGRVEVSSALGKKVVIVKNQQADLKNNSDFQISKDDSTEGIAWTSNTIVLKNTSLSETAKIIENWYNVEISFEDQEIKKLTISGKFKDEKLENVLESIAFLKQLKIIYLTQNHILIRKKTP
ncbi:FecR domain-containing protein [Flavobacterium aquidurense]|uniref:FecR family protein n=1 Tax=Flavobacterium aquidurense TaxID=362413 RepID=UPI00285F2C37|nr:FecR domain-containing protein [Flavobacterium aquidurense]MDR7371462.1 ferric-dicitrate binding protein FerR (iron transport regulator) [Flavobacterium aquidurense]